MTSDATIPITAHIDLTYRCNLLCAHCILPTRFERDELSAAEVAGVLGDLAAEGTLFVGFSGGEVFLRKDLDSILAVADERRFYVYLFTHGNFVAGDQVEMIRNRHVAEVHVSLYSVRPDVHEAVTRVPGSHAKTLRAIDLLLDAGVRVALKCPLMRFNYEYRDEVKEFAVAKGARLVLTPEIQPTYAGELHPLGTLVPARNIPPIYLDTLGDSEFRRLASVKTHGFDASPLCAAGRSRVYIGPAGDVAACASLASLPAGNVRERSIREIWRESSVFGRIRGIRQQDRTECKACPDANVCTFCMASSWLSGHDLLKPATFNCDQTRARKRAVDEFRRGLPVVS